MVTETDKPNEVACAMCGRPIPISIAVSGSRFSFNPACAECIAKAEAKAEEERRQRASAAKRQAVEAIRADVPAALERCGVPVTWRSASFDQCPNLPANLVRRARAWADKPTGLLYLYGQPGAGKTWVAVAILRHILETGVLPLSACRYTGERDFLDCLRAEYDAGPRSAPVPDSPYAPHGPLTVPVLVFDDLAATRLTDWGRGEVAGLIESRYADLLPTIITSNVEPRDLGDAVDGRIQSRIAGDKQMLGFPACDLRRTAKTRLFAQ